MLPVKVLGGMKDWKSGMDVPEENAIPDIFLVPLSVCAVHRREVTYNSLKDFCGNSVSTAGKDPGKPNSKSRESVICRLF